MDKNNLYKKYLSVWQLVGDYLRKRKCIKSAKKETTITLNKIQLAEVLRYWKPYASINPIFHSFYTEKTGVFDERYIPDDLYYTKIDTFYNDWNAAKIVDNKCYYENIFSPVGGVKHPVTFIRRINGIWLDEKWNQIEIDQVFEIIQSNSSFFLKLATQSEGGKGVFFFDTSNLDYKEAFISIVGAVMNDLVVQKPIKQCTTLAEINPSSVNTIRILSLLRNGEVKVYSSILRMGINEAKVDNASSGGITCGIDENGYLKKVAYSAKGKRYDVHPASKVIFSDICVPSYVKAVELVKKLHPILPNFRLISWDIAIDQQKEPVLLEVNLKYGELDFHQLNNGPLFGDDTKEILNEVFSK